MEFRAPGCGFQAEVDAVDKINQTPLYLAARFGHAAVATKLLQANAAVDAANANGETPLHWAAGNGQAAVAELLLQANASPTAVTKYGQTPADIAKQLGDERAGEAAAGVSAGRCFEVNAGGVEESMPMLCAAACA